MLLGLTLRQGIINSDVPNPWFEYHVKDYIENSLVVGSDNWNKLVQAAVDNRIYVVSSEFSFHFVTTPGVSRL